MGTNRIAAGVATGLVAAGSWVVVVGLGVSDAHGALVVADGATRTITFDSAIGWDDGVAGNDVLRSIRVGTTDVDNGNAQFITDADAWDYSPWNAGGHGLSSSAWRYTNQYFSWTDAYGNVNDNAATDDRRETYDVSGVDSTQTGLIDGKALYFQGNRWGTRALTLRVTNATGQAVDAWSVSLGAVVNDAAYSAAKLTLEASLDEATWQSLDSFTTANTGAGWTATDGLAGASTLSVPAGGSLFLRVAYDNLGGSGDGIAIDDIAVTAQVPEPATAGLVVLGAAGILLRRRRCA